jgi:hypothetical protein
VGQESEVVSGLYSGICSQSIGDRSRRGPTDHGLLNTTFFRLLNFGS